MLLSRLQHSFYLFISLKIPPQIPSLSTWLQSSKWDRVGNGLLFCLENIHTITSLKKWLCYDWQFSDFFACIWLIEASSSCCSWEQRLAAVRVSLQDPVKTLDHLPQLQQVTPWDGSPLHADRPKPKNFCMERASCHCAHGCSHCCTVHTSCSQPRAECSAFSSTSGFLSGPDMKHHSSMSQVSQINLIHKLREDLMLLHATKHQNTFLTLTDDSTPSLISTVLFVVVFFLTFLSIIVWLHMVNENCCMQRVLFCYQLNSGSPAGFWNKPEVVAMISFLLENLPFPWGSVQGNILVCSQKFTV